MANSRKQVIAFAEEYIEDNFSTIDRKTRRLLRLHLVSLLGRLHFAPVLPVSREVEDLIRGFAKLVESAESLRPTRKNLSQNQLARDTANLIKTEFKDFQIGFRDAAFKTVKKSGYQYSTPKIVMKFSRKRGRRNRRVLIEFKSLEDRRKPNDYVFIHSRRLVDLMGELKTPKPTRVLEDFVSKAAKRFPRLKITGPRTANAFIKTIHRKLRVSSALYDYAAPGEMDALAKANFEYVINF